MKKKHEMRVVYAKPMINSAWPYIACRTNILDCSWEVSSSPNKPTLVSALHIKMDKSGLVSTQNACFLEGIVG